MLTFLEFGEYVKIISQSGIIKRGKTVLTNISEVVLWYCVVALKTFVQILYSITDLVSIL